MTTRDDKTWAVAAHLLGYLTYATGIGGIVGPLVIYLVNKDESRYVAEHAKEALNFQISMFVYGLIAWLLCFVLIGFPILVVLFILHVVLPIFGAVKAAEGSPWRYPLTVRLV